jgi:hypothetical protein
MTNELLEKVERLRIECTTRDGWRAEHDELVCSILEALVKGEGKTDPKPERRRESILGVLRIDVMDQRTGDAYHSDFAFEDGQTLFIHGVRVWPPIEETEHDPLLFSHRNRLQNILGATSNAGHDLCDAANEMRTAHALIMEYALCRDICHSKEVILPKLIQYAQKHGAGNGKPDRCDCEAHRMVMRYVECYRGLHIGEQQVTEAMCEYYDRHKRNDET